MIRRALRFHVEQFSSERVKQAIEGMLALGDSLRSSLAKNAILTLADLFTFLSEGLITDAQTSDSYKRLIRKVADTNAFLSSEARKAL